MFKTYRRTKNVLEPEILTHPNIPKPLHGINPRTIKGVQWWDIQRQKIYKEQNYCCKACGIHKYKALGSKKWLECHEVYDYDFNKGVLTFKKLIALCHYCHLFIHSGRLVMLLQKHEISIKEFNDINGYGLSILKDNNLRDEWHNRHNDYVEEKIEWSDWCLIFEGKKYYSKFKSYDEWCNYYGN